MGGTFKSRKEADNKKGKKKTDKEGLIDGIDREMSLTRLFDNIRTAKRVISIEDHPGYAREIVNRIKELNPDAEILTARTLKDARNYIDLVDGDTVVLSDYYFLPYLRLGVEPMPLAREIHEIIGERAKAFAIITMGSTLEKEDKDLEWFRLSKADFIGKERMEELMKKKVIVAADEEIFTYETIQHLRKEYKGYIFAAPGFDRSDYTPVEIIVLVSSRENEEKELKIIKKEFKYIFETEFDEKLHKETISSQDLER